MAMIKCPECGAEISTRAAACVKCGLPLSDIFICPECNSISIKESGGCCTKCGCPFEEEIESKASVPIETKSTVNNEKDDAEKSMAKYIEISEKIIKTTLFKMGNLSGTGLLCDGGFPISNETKVEKIKIAFDIPDRLNVFFAASGNTFSTFNENAKGFAISSYGVHFRDDRKRKGSFSLIEFADAKIGISFVSYLTIASFEFNLGLECSKVKRFLEELQNEIRLHL